MTTTSPLGPAELEGADHGATIFLSGEIDSASAPSFAEVCDLLTDRQLAGEVVVDLGGVTFFDSTALSVLAGLAKASAAVGGTVLLINLPTTVRRLLEITRMADAFSLAPAPGPTEKIGGASP